MPIKSHENDIANYLSDKIDEYAREIKEIKSAPNSADMIVQKHLALGAMGALCDALNEVKEIKKRIGLN